MTKGERNDFAREPAQGTRFPFNIYRYNVSVDDGNELFKGTINSYSKDDARRQVTERFRNQNFVITDLRRADRWFEQRYGKGIHQKIEYTPHGMKLSEGHTREEINADVEKARQERKKK